jgi:hypothetical protein
MKPSLVCALSLTLLLPALAGAQPRPAVRVLAERTVELPFSGQRLTLRETLDPATGTTRREAFVAGVPIDEQAALARERDARWDAIGNLDPALAAELDAAAAATLRMLVRFALDQPRTD